MARRNASARWEGTLQEGNGTVKLGSGAFEGQYSYRSRFEEGEGTNPEELIGAAHAGCFSMQLSAQLERAGHPVDSVETEATVEIKPVDGSPTITSSVLRTRARVPGVDEDEFQRQAEEAKAGCAVSRALGAIDISLEATLEA